MYYHIIPKIGEKSYEISKEKVEQRIEMFHLNINNCKIYCSEKNLDEIASIFEQRRIQEHGDTINGLYTRDSAIQLDGKQEFIKECTYDFFL